MITTGRLKNVSITALLVGLGLAGWFHRSKPERAPELTSAIPAPEPQRPIGPAPSASVPPPAAEQAHATPTTTSAPLSAPATADPAKIIKPSFDLVRVARTGDAVLAGLCTPQWRIALFSNGELIGKTVTGADGEWVLIPERRLSQTDQALVIRATSPDGKTTLTSEQSVVIGMVGEGSPPIVLIEEPEKPSALVQAPPALAALNVPPAEQPTIAAPTAVSGAMGTAGAALPAPPPPAIKTAAEQPGDAPAVRAAPPEAVPAAPPDGRAAIPPAFFTPAPAAPAANASAAAPSPSYPAHPPAETRTAAAPPPQSARSDAEEAASLVAPDLLAEAKPTLAALSPEEPEVIANPHGPTQEVLAVETVGYEENGKLHITGRAGAGATLRAYLNDVFLRDVTNSEDGAFSMSFEAFLETGSYRIRVDSVAPETGEVVERVEVPFERTPKLGETTSATPPARLGEARVFGGVTGGRSAETVAEPKIIVIRKNDNLWTISRKIYGRGIRYTHIYQANLDQIKDPDLIYPGQIFVIPQMN